MLLLHVPFVWGGVFKHYPPRAQNDGSQHVAQIPLFLPGHPGCNDLGEM